jgi:hypothetical protein
MILSFTMYRPNHPRVERGNGTSPATEVNVIWSKRFHIAQSSLFFVSIMREKDSFRKKNLLTKIENLIAKWEAERNNLPNEEYKSNVQYIQGFLAGLEEARRIVKGIPSSGRRPSEIHQRLNERRKKGNDQTEGEGHRLTS